VTGDGVRITGLRLRGPDPKRRVEYHRWVFYEGHGGDPAYYKFPCSQGVGTDRANLEVDNCELSGWSQTAIGLYGESKHHLHHNHIHHNQRMGLGYGVTVARKAWVLIEYNLFDANKHSIAGTGEPGCGYEARHNVALPGPVRLPDFAGQSHIFDMHGGVDRQDGTNIAGDAIEIHHNTFATDEVQAVNIRGVPSRLAHIYRNWFYSPKPGREVVEFEGNVEVQDNAYGRERPAADPPG
jgi:hypothetical protein